VTVCSRDFVEVSTFDLTHDSCFGGVWKEKRCSVSSSPAVTPRCPNSLLITDPEKRLLLPEAFGRFSWTSAAAECSLSQSKMVETEVAEQAWCSVSFSTFSQLSNEAGLLDFRRARA